jgi:predicted lipoprotein with Yx(FWY)xxD motif
MAKSIHRLSARVTYGGQTMTRTRALPLLAAAATLVLSALAGAGCGSASGGSTASSGPPKSTPPPPTLDVSTNRLGEVLVDSKGRTLYLFKKDMGPKSACSGACASAWPPVRVNGKPTVAGDAKASKVSTTKRPDGAAQIVYSGHPLYLYQGDDKPGDANGQGVNAWGGRWFALSPAGKQILKASKPKGGGSGY